MSDAFCPKCSRPVPPENLNTGSAFTCQGCRGEIVLDVFPAVRRMHVAVPAGSAGEGEAVCFYHDHRAAQAACDGCGRYVCALCDVPVGRQHLCPECLASRNREGRGQMFPSRRLRGDLLALALAVLPVVLVFTIFLSIVTAPAALVIVFVMWRKPPSLVGWTRTWLVVAGVIASLEILGWLTALVTAIVR